MAAAKGGEQSAALLLLDLAKFCEHVGHEHLWEEGDKTSFPRRLLASWCGSYEGWRFLEADKCYLPFLGLLDHSPRVQWRHHGSQIDVAPSSGNCGISSLDMRALRCCRRRFGTRCWVPWDGSGPHCRSGQAPGGGPRGTDKVKQGLLRQLEELGIDECDTARNAGADLQPGRRPRRQEAPGEGSEAHETRQAASEGRGAHWQFDSHWFECWGALGVRGSGLHSNTAQSHRSRRGQSRRGQNASTTMMAHAQAAWAKNIDVAFRHHRKVVLAWATGVWDGVPDLDTMQAALRGSIARPSCLKRPWCGATEAAATFVLTLLRLGWSAQSARHLTTHDGTTIDRLAVAPKTVGFSVDQASLMWSDSSAHWDKSEGPLFWGAVRPLLVSGWLEEWSLWHRNVVVKLVSCGIWTQDRPGF